MRKAILLLAFLLVSLTGYGQRNYSYPRRYLGQFGLVAGAATQSTDIKGLELSSISSFHAGVAYSVNLTSSFTIQPELLYSVKGTVEEGHGIRFSDTTAGYVELPVQFQWGPDFHFMHPFLLAEPFTGFRLDAAEKGLSFGKDLLRRLEYGLGVGAGLQLGGFQLTGRYFWSFGDLREGDKGSSRLWDELHEPFAGISVSAALLF